MPFFYIYTCQNYGTNGCKTKINGFVTIRAIFYNVGWSPSEVFYTIIAKLVILWATLITKFFKKSVSNDIWGWKKVKNNLHIVLRVFFQLLLKNFIHFLYRTE